MIIHNLEQGSEEWLKIRIGKFTASSFHVFLGNSKTKENELYKKAAERITGVKCDSDTFSNKHTERGNKLEDEARSIYELLNDVMVDEVGFIELDKNTGYSPDGLIGEEGLLEIKCKDNHTFLRNKIKGEKGIESQYRTQIQFGLYVTGRKWCDYVCYNPNFNDSLIFIRIFRDEEKISKIAECLNECNIKIDEIIKGFES